MSTTSSSTDPYAASTDLTSTTPSHNHHRQPQANHASPVHPPGKAVSNGVSSSVVGEEEEEEEEEGAMEGAGQQAYKVPKMEQWLALRVHGGARNWPKFPSCFHNPNS